MERRLTLLRLWKTQNKPNQNYNIGVTILQNASEMLV